MKFVKKIGFLLLAVVMMTCCFSTVTPVRAESAYGFKSKGVTVTPGKDAAKFIKANKKYLKKTTNTKTCIAKSGYDVTREYKYFTLVTYSASKNGKGKVESISITNTSVTTPEGLSCGMDEDEIEKYYEDAKKVGSCYSTSKGKTKIVISVDKGKVSEIEYLYTGKF